MPAETLSPPKLLESPSEGVHWWFDDYFSRLTPGSPAPWNLTTLSRLLALVILWAAWMFATWAHWGNLTIDTGREMYIPAVLAEGKMLYRDIWFIYGPAAPYFNSSLFHRFGVHLNVLYLAGALSALGSAIRLYLIGMRLSFALAGWTAGVVVVISRFSSVPVLFSFAL
jgi:hypothetical protein